MFSSLQFEKSNTWSENEFKLLSVRESSEKVQGKMTSMLFLANNRKEFSIHMTVTRGRAKKVKRQTRREFWLEMESKGRAPVNHQILKRCMAILSNTSFQIIAIFLSLSLSFQDSGPDRCLVWPTRGILVCFSYSYILELMKIRVMKRRNSRKAGKGHYLPFIRVRQSKNHDSLNSIPKKRLEHISKLTCKWCTGS